MKIRNGFVSNSSSSSFILDKEFLTKDQILLIKNHHLCKSIPYAKSDSWDVTETDGEIHLFTMQDNFSMYKYLTQIVRVPYESIKDSEYLLSKEDFVSELDSEAQTILKEIKGDNYEN